MVELLLALTGTQVQQEQKIGHRQHISTTSNLKTDYSSLAESINSFTKTLTRYMYVICLYIVGFSTSCGGRVVKAMDLKSIRVSLRRFESCPQRFFFFSFPKSCKQESITNLIINLHRSCVDIVREVVDIRRQEGYPNPEEEQDDLRRLGDEAQEWTKQAGLLLKEVTTNQVEMGWEEEKKEEEEGKSVADEGDLKKELPEVMNVIGVDDNIHPKSLQQVIDEVSNLLSLI